MTPDLARRVEQALTHALGQALGPLMRPKQHRGQENKEDAQAVGVLFELRRELRLKSAVALEPVAPIPEPKDSLS